MHQKEGNVSKILKTIKLKYQGRTKLMMKKYS